MNSLQSESINPERSEEEREDAKAQFDVTNEILSLIQTWKTTRNDKTKIDIEILLEIVEKIENRIQDTLYAFYENNSLKIENHPAYKTVFGSNRKFSSQIKHFIKKTFSNTRMNIGYLNPLNSFIREYGGISIFSTNYDVCIEQFCIENGRKFVDGFNPTWNPEIEYQKLDVHLRLYKLHGSITWYRSEGGDYVRSDLIAVDQRPILVGGLEVTPLILYPGRKLEYIEPIIYMLIEIKRQLEEADYVISASFPTKIELRFQGSGGNISPDQLAGVMKTSQASQKKD